MPQLKFYNTPHRAVEKFTPSSDDKTVTVYTCGPTVYSSPQIGNWVAYIRWDILVRVLDDAGLSVRRVMNITDVGHLVSDADDGEDKMVTGARREGVTAWDVAARYTAEFIDGMNLLGLIPPTHLVKATDHIQQQIDLIKRLESKGHTYVIDDGVYFDTATFGGYETFAKLDLAGMQAGARVDFNSAKRHVADFALWKFSPENTRRDMEWDSPWGKGFPGWHIECSAMAMNLLGETIDIHTGGIDHIPVHHTNEIAQSEAATGVTFSRFWLHANFLTVDGTKISKSLGNGYTIADITEQGFHPFDFKMFVLQSHYRSESNFSWDNLAAAQARRRRLINVACLRWQAGHEAQGSDGQAAIDAAEAGIREALFDDLNTPKALALIDNLLSTYDTRRPDTAEAVRLGQFISVIDELLGLDVTPQSTDISKRAQDLMAERDEARAARNYALSDELRDRLATEEDVFVRDTADGTVWQRFAS